MVPFFLNLHNYIIINGIGFAAQTDRNAYQMCERADVQVQENKFNKCKVRPSQLQDKRLIFSSWQHLELESILIREAGYDLGTFEKKV